ncbi:MAG: diguanylate cyclase, partial [Alphaproteobacteria bacterium]|nr:diguanylate cyclase [Alphaproteobacteria bacterium]
ILRAVDLAIEEHGNWLTRWHRALVCGLPPDADVIAENSMDLTKFGRWHEQHRRDSLLSQPAFQDLWQSYVDLHNIARDVACKAGNARVSAQDYDGVMVKSNAFLTRARRIRDAFRKAVSDLDPLTGLSNRTTMNTELAAEYERAVRSNTPCCIALADIDHFKKVNDTHGHGIGDQVLAAAAGRFLSQLRPYDLIYRYGGEEFLLCLPNADPKTAAGVLERLREALFERPIPLENGSELLISASFGFSQIEGSRPLKEVITQADQALYQAKQAGRNRVVGFKKDQ